MKPTRFSPLLCVGITSHYWCTNAFSDGTNPNKSCGRREALRGISIGGILGAILSCAAPAAAVVPLQTTSGIIRVEGIGGGLDLLNPQPLASSDVLYPSSMIDTNWKVQRVVTSVEGDVGQATLAWELLGGYDERAVGGYGQR